MASGGFFTNQTVGEILKGWGYEVAEPDWSTFKFADGDKQQLVERDPSKLKAAAGHGYTQTDDQSFKVVYAVAVAHEPKFRDVVLAAMGHLAESADYHSMAVAMAQGKVESVLHHVGALKDPTGLLYLFQKGYADCLEDSFTCLQPSLAERLTVLEARKQTARAKKLHELAGLDFTKYRLVSAKQFMDPVGQWSTVWPVGPVQVSLTFEGTEYKPEWYGTGHPYGGQQTVTFSGTDKEKLGAAEAIVWLQCGGPKKFQEETTALMASAKMDALNPKSMDWVNEHAAQMVTAISEQTRQNIKSTMQAHFQGQLTVPQAIAAIRYSVGLSGPQAGHLQKMAAQGASDGAMQAYMKQARDYRAQMIARTETIAASNRGQQALWDEAVDKGFLDPAQYEKRVILTVGACEVCQAEGEVGMDLDASNIPPYHPNCRCAMGLDHKTGPLGQAPAEAGAGEEEEAEEEGAPEEQPAVVQLHKVAPTVQAQALPQAPSWDACQVLHGHLAFVEANPTSEVAKFFADSAEPQDCSFVWDDVKKADAWMTAHLKEWKKSLKPMEYEVISDFAKGKLFDDFGGLGTKGTIEQLLDDYFASKASGSPLPKWAADKALTRIKALDGAAEKFSLPANVTTYGWVKLADVNEAAQLHNHSYLKVYLAPGAGQTADMKEGTEWAKVQLAPGQHGIYLDAWSKAGEGQGRFLLPRDTTLKLVGKDEKDQPVFHVMDPVTGAAVGLPTGTADPMKDGLAVEEAKTEVQKTVEASFPKGSWLADWSVEQIGRKLADVDICILTHYHGNHIGVKHQVDFVDEKGNVHAVDGAVLDLVTGIKGAMEATVEPKFAPGNLLQDPEMGGVWTVHAVDGDKVTLWADDPTGKQDHVEMVQDASTLQDWPTLYKPAKAPEVEIPVTATVKYITDIVPGSDIKWTYAGYDFEGHVVDVDQHMDEAHVKVTKADQEDYVGKDFYLDQQMLDSGEGIVYEVKAIHPDEGAVAAPSVSTDPLVGEWHQPVTGSHYIVEPGSSLGEYKLTLADDAGNVTSGPFDHLTEDTIKSYIGGADKVGEPGVKAGPGVVDKVGQALTPGDTVTFDHTGAEYLYLGLDVAGEPAFQKVGGGPTIHLENQVLHGNIFLPSSEMKTHEAVGKETAAEILKDHPPSSVAGLAPGASAGPAVAGKLTVTMDETLTKLGTGYQSLKWKTVEYQGGQYKLVGFVPSKDQFVLEGADGKLKHVKTVTVPAEWAKPIELPGKPAATKVLGLDDVEVGDHVAYSKLPGADFEVLSKNSDKGTFHLQDDEGHDFTVHELDLQAGSATVEKQVAEEPPPLPSTPIPVTSPTAQLGPPDLTGLKAYKKSVGGAHPKDFYKTKDGVEWMFKPDPDPITSIAEKTGNDVLAALGMPSAEIYVQPVGSKLGSLQRWIDGLTPVTQSMLPSLPKEQVEQIQRHQVVDWLLSQHDTNDGALLRDSAGNIYAVDKGQAFKFFGRDKLSSTYNPNPNPIVYNKMFQDFKAGKVQLSWEALEPALQAIEKMPEAQLRALVKPYGDQMAKSTFRPGTTRELFKTSDEFVDAVVKRAATIRADFEKLYKDNGVPVVAPPPKPKPAISVAGAHTPLDAGFVQELGKAGWAGKAVMVKGSDLEDAHVLAYTIQKGAGQVLAIEGKVQPEGEAKLKQALNLKVAASAAPLPKVDDPVWDPFVAAVKTINIHLKAGGDGQPNAQTIAGLKGAAEKALASGNAELVKHYDKSQFPALTGHSLLEVKATTPAQLMDWVKQTKAVGLPFEQFIPPKVSPAAQATAGKPSAPAGPWKTSHPYLKAGETVQAYAAGMYNGEDLAGVNLTVLKSANKDNAKYQSKEAVIEVKAPSGKTYTFQQGDLQRVVVQADPGSPSVPPASNEPVKVTQTTPNRLKVTNEGGTLKTTGASLSEGSGTAYSLDFGNGVTAVYVPHGDSSKYSKMGRFVLYDESPGPVTPEKVLNALSQLKRAGLDLQLADMADLELVYLQKQAFAMKLDQAADYKAVLAKWSGSTTTQEKVDSLVAYFNGKLKVADVRTLPGYKPAPQFNSAYNPSAGVKNSGTTAQRPFWTRFDVTPAGHLKGLHLIHNLSMSQPAFWDSVLSANGWAANTEERIRMGLASVSGMSSGTDQTTGGASYFFTRLRKSPGGSFTLSPELLLRTDNISYAWDNYGRSDPTNMTKRSSGLGDDQVVKWENAMKGIDGNGTQHPAHGTDNETIIKSGFNLLDYVTQINAGAQKQQVIDIFKKHGVLSIRGVPIEQVVK